MKNSGKLLFLSSILGGSLFSLFLFGCSEDRREGLIGAMAGCGFPSVDRSGFCCGM